jgi:hypothetical protein
MTKLPNFKVEAHSSFGPSVGWEDSERRYHFWLGKDGLPSGDTLHSNLIIKPEKYGDSGHRKMSLSAKRWAPVIAGIMEKIKAEDLIAKAEQHAEDAAQEREAKRIADIHSKNVARLHRALKTLPTPIADAMLAMSDEIKVAFVFALDIDI